MDFPFFKMATRGKLLNSIQVDHWLSGYVLSTSWSLDNLGSSPPGSHRVEMVAVSYGSAPAAEAKISRVNTTRQVKQHPCYAFELVTAAETCGPQH
jgi:hypothetical protein